MALQDYDKNRQYTKYKRHVNESHERVNAETVNTLQNDLNTQQRETNSIKDTAFEERVYTIFNNNLYTNAMFVDYFKTGEYIDMNSSRDIVVDYPMTQMTIDKNSENGNGLCVSTIVYSIHGSDVEMNDFFLIANEDIPIGASIKYYIETTTGERWPILPNALKLPMHLSENIKYGFRVIIELKSNALKEFPKLNGYAILYWDAKVEEGYGLTNPDLIRFPQGRNRL